MNFSKPSLVVEELSFTWPDGTAALSKCSFSISESGLWMLVGKNGSGKSTLFRLINGMLKSQSGKITCSLNPYLVSQNPDHHILLPTCKSDLLLSVKKDLNSFQRTQLIHSTLKKIGMERMENRPIHTLSGGQKQRLAIAGALLSGSNLLLLDEPTALLDPISQKSILELVKKLCSDSKNPMIALWITHRLDELKYCSGAAMVENGRVGDWISGNDIHKRFKTLALR